MWTVDDFLRVFGIKLVEGDSCFLMANYTAILSLELYMRTGGNLVLPYAELDLDAVESYIGNTGAVYTPFDTDTDAVTSYLFDATKEQYGTLVKILAALERTGDVSERILGQSMAFDLSTFEFLRSYSDQIVSVDLEDRWVDDTLASYGHMFDYYRDAMTHISSNLDRLIDDGVIFYTRFKRITVNAPERSTILTDNVVKTINVWTKPGIVEIMSGGKAAMVVAWLKSLNIKATESTLWSI